MDTKSLQSNFSFLFLLGDHFMPMPKYGKIGSSGYLSICDSLRSNDYRCFLIVVKASGG